MPGRWHHLVATLLVRSYFRRVAVVHRDRLPRGGPVLYVGLHRNGAIDGAVYKTVLPRATFLIAAQLVRSAFGRLFFAGIPVARPGDADDPSGNATALAACVAHLTAGGELFVMPEGTSDLGPRHRPFKTGAARILSDALARGAPVTVIPVGIFYTCPDGFRSDVSVVVGEPVATELSTGLDAADRVAELHGRMTGALESLGVNVDTADALQRLERLAAVAAEGDPARQYVALKRLERLDPPDAVAAAWRRLEAAAQEGRLATERAVPVFSRRGALWSAGWLALQAPLVALAALVNAVPLAAAAIAGRRLADARNTVTLWRLLVGAPVGAAWIAAVGLAAVLTGEPWLALGYGATSAAGLALYPELLARWPRFRNARARAPHADFETVRAWLAAVVPPAGRDRAPPVLAHEVAFTAMVAIVWSRLAVARGLFAPEPLYWLTLAAIAVGSIAVNRYRPAWWSWRVRLGAFFVLMNAAYMGMGRAVAAAGTPLRDGLLQRLDTAIFGGVLPVLVDRWKHPAVTEVMSFCYLLFFPYLTFSVVRQLWRVPHDPATAQRFAVGLYGVYAVGFVGYFLVPAQGAYLDLPAAFGHPLDTGWIARLNEAVVRRGTNRVDVFPSLHVAVSAYLLWFDARTARWRYWAYLAPAFGLWLSTIYLRYHYGIDVVCGFALAAAAVTLAFRAPVHHAPAPHPAVR